MQATIVKLNNKNHDFGIEYEGTVYRGNDALGKLCRALDCDGTLDLVWPCGKKSGTVNIRKRAEKSLVDNNKTLRMTKYVPNPMFYKDSV